MDNLNMHSTSIIIVVLNYHLNRLTLTYGCTSETMGTNGFDILGHVAHLVFSIPCVLGVIYFAICLSS